MANQCRWPASCGWPRTMEPPAYRPDHVAALGGADDGGHHVLLPATGRERSRRCCRGFLSAPGGVGGQYAQLLAALVEQVRHGVAVGREVTDRVREACVVRPGPAVTQRHLLHLGGLAHTVVVEAHDRDSSAHRFRVAASSPRNWASTRSNSIEMGAYGIENRAGSCLASNTSTPLNRRGGEDNQRG